MNHIINSKFNGPALRAGAAMPPQPSQRGSDSLFQRRRRPRQRPHLPRQHRNCQLSERRTHNPRKTPTTDLLPLLRCHQHTRTEDTNSTTRTHRPHQQDQELMANFRHQHPRLPQGVRGERHRELSLWHTEASIAVV